MTTASLKTINGTVFSKERKNVSAGSGIIQLLSCYLIAISANAGCMDLGFIVGGAKNSCQARELNFLQVINYIYYNGIHNNLILRPSLGTAHYYYILLAEVHSSSGLPVFGRLLKQTCISPPS